MNQSKLQITFLFVFFNGLMGFTGPNLKAADASAKQPGDSQSSISTKSPNQSAASKGIFTVLQKAPVCFFSDLTEDVHTMLFGNSEALDLYEIDSGRLIKSIRATRDYSDKLYFRHGTATSILICKEDGVVAQTDTSTEESKTILKDIPGRFVGYDSKKDCLFVYNFEKKSLIKVDVNDGKREQLCGSLTHSIDHVIVDSRGIINSIGMGGEAAGEPQTWIDSFSSSEDGFRVVHRGSKAISRVVSVLGIPTHSKLKIRRLLGWETLGKWTNVEIGENVTWLDASLNSLPKPGWLFCDSSGDNPLSARNAGLNLLSLRNGVVHTFPGSTTLITNGISASETGANIMWWRLNDDPLLSIANSNGKSKMPQDIMSYPSPNIFHLSQAKYEPLNLGKYIVWNAALNPSGSSACFVVTDPFAQKSIAYRKKSSMFDDKVLEFKSNCLIYNFSDKKIKIGSATGGVNVCL